MLYSKKKLGLGSMAQVVGAPSWTLKGLWFDPWSGMYRRQPIDVS